MKLTQQQHEATHLIDKEAFIDLLCEELVEAVAWLERAWSVEKIRSMVAYSYDRATIANKLATDTDIRRYCYIFFAISAAFDQHPILFQLLHDSNLSSEQRWRKFSDPNLEPIWQQLMDEELRSPCSGSNLFPEAKGSVAEAYPTTHHLPGFQELYRKVRTEQFPFLEDGESLDDV